MSGLAAEADLSRPNAVPFEIRPLASLDDFARAVQLQRLTWGHTFREIVPAAILKITQRVGGITAGAFLPDGDLVGLVFGMSGFAGGRAVHWSHMLAVEPEYRDQGIGRRLKEYQRASLLAVGIEWMYWTFDPLVARNAHFNLNRLHASITDYVPDMYGDTGSGLHAFGTDRFVMVWPLVGRALQTDTVVLPQPESGRLLNDLVEGELNALLTGVEPGPVFVEVPADLERTGVSEGGEWRKRTRRAFLTALSAGYQVSGFTRAHEGRCYYVLTPPLPPAASE